jgi:hypothetical protein
MHDGWIGKENGFKRHHTMPKGISSSVLFFDQSQEHNGKGWYSSARRETSVQKR